MEFAEVYTTYYPKIATYCKARILSDWEDTTADVFARAFVAWPRYESRTPNPLPWLYTIAHNEVVSRYRKAANRDTTLSSLPYDILKMHAQGENPTDRISDQMNGNARVLELALALAIVRIPEVDWRLIFFELSEGKQLIEIAKERNLNYETLKTKIAKVRNYIAIRLQHNVDFQEAQEIHSRPKMRQGKYRAAVKV